MKTTTKTLLIAVLALSVATPALAGRGPEKDHKRGPDRGYVKHPVKGHGSERVFKRLKRQHRRIESGIDSGELTRREARRLKKQQRRIRRLAYDMSEDGRLSRRDRRELHDRLDRASDRIYRFKHNDATRHRNHRHYSESSWGGDEVLWLGYSW